MMRETMLASLVAFLLLGAPARSAFAHDEDAVPQNGLFSEEKTIAVVVGLAVGGVVGSYLTQPTMTGALLGAAIAAWWYDEKGPAASFLPKRLGASMPTESPRPLSVIAREAPGGSARLVLRAADKVEAIPTAADRRGTEGGL